MNKQRLQEIELKKYDSAIAEKRIEEEKDLKKIGIEECRKLEQQRCKHEAEMQDKCNEEKCLELKLKAQRNEEYKYELEIQKESNRHEAEMQDKHNEAKSLDLKIQEERTKEKHFELKMQNKRNQERTLELKCLQIKLQLQQKEESG